MAIFKEARISKKLTHALKKHLIRLPRRLLQLKKASYKEIPAAHSHQEEVDENALNEALEARLMELIASAPAQDKPITIKLDVAVNNSNNSPDLFAFAGTFVCMPHVQTRCQNAQAQV